MNEGPTPRRRRTTQDAEAMLHRALNLTPAEKCQAMLRIRRAKQPKVEARRIIKHFQLEAMAEVCRHDGTVDPSDAQELRIKLLRRGRIWPPQSTWLLRLERRLAKGTITPAQFRAEAAALLAMKPALPKSFLEAESRFLREFA